MFCTKCGKKIEDETKFCTGCGAPAAMMNLQQPVQNPQGTMCREQMMQNPQMRANAAQQQYQPMPQPQLRRSRALVITGIIVIIITIILIVLVKAKVYDDAQYWYSYYSSHDYMYENVEEGIQQTVNTMALAKIVMYIIGIIGTVGGLIFICVGLIKRPVKQPKPKAMVMHQRQTVQNFYAVADSAQPQIMYNSQGANAAARQQPIVQNSNNVTGVHQAMQNPQMTTNSAQQSERAPTPCVRRSPALIITGIVLILAAVILTVLLHGSLSDCIAECDDFHYTHDWWLEWTEYYNRPIVSAVDEIDALIASCKTAIYIPGTISVICGIILLCFGLYKKANASHVSTTCLGQQSPKLPRVRRSPAMIVSGVLFILITVVAVVCINSQLSYQAGVSYDFFSDLIRDGYGDVSTDGVSLAEALKSLTSMLMYSTGIIGGISGIIFVCAGLIKKPRY